MKLWLKRLTNTLPWKRRPEESGPSGLTGPIDPDSGPTSIDASSDEHGLSELLAGIDVPDRARPVVAALRAYLNTSDWSFDLPLTADQHDPAARTAQTCLAWMLWLTWRHNRGLPHTPCPWWIRLEQHAGQLVPVVRWSRTPNDTALPVDPRWWTGLDHALHQERDARLGHDLRLITIDPSGIVAILSLVLPVWSLWSTGKVGSAQVLFTTLRDRRPAYLVNLWYDELCHMVQHRRRADVPAEQAQEIRAFITATGLPSGQVTRMMMDDWTGISPLPPTSHWLAASRVRLSLTGQSWDSDLHLVAPWFGDKGQWTEESTEFLNDHVNGRRMTVDRSIKAMRRTVERKDALDRTMQSFRGDTRLAMDHYGVWPALMELAVLFQIDPSPSEDWLMARWDQWLDAEQDLRQRLTRPLREQVPRLLEEARPEALGLTWDQVHLLKKTWREVSKKRDAAAKAAESGSASETPESASSGSTHGPSLEFQACTGPLREFTNSELFAPLVKDVPLQRVTLDVWVWQDAMDRAFPWMTGLTARIVRRLSIQKAQGLPMKLPTLALLGPPGVGKNLYWDEAMRHMDHPFIVQNMGGSNDSMAIKGTTAGWSTERPGVAAWAMSTTRCGNPVVLLDEIDKAGGNDRNGHAVDAMLPLLDVRTASRYLDDCLQAPINASHISWVMTLNNEAALTDALRNRVEVVEVPGPDWSNPVHLDAALKMGEDLSWQRWGSTPRTQDNELSHAQRDDLRKVRWKSLRSLGQAIEAMLEDNLYRQSVEGLLEQDASGSVDG